MAKLDYLLPSDYFQNNLEHLVLPYLTARQTIMTVNGYDGNPLSARIYRQEESDTVICISHGFCEFSERYSEIIYYFLKEGYSVAIMDHRSHGYSYRPLPNMSKIHVENYGEFVQDYHCFVEKIKEQFPDHRRFLFGHSMGGCIAALYQETYPEDFEKLVLSSPMLDMKVAVPKPLCKCFGRFMILLHKGEYYLGSQKQDWTPREKFEDSCGTERGRFQAWMDMRIKNPYYQTSAGTIRWMTESIAAANKAVAQAKKIQIPVLLLQAGNDSLIAPEGQEKFIRTVKNGKMIHVPYAKHEIFNCDGSSRLTFWQEVMDFYARK